VKARHVRKAAAGKPKLVKANLRRPPPIAIRRRALPPEVLEDPSAGARRQTLDDYLNRAEVGELVDPPH
jgi:hypothetical protein